MKFQKLLFFLLFASVNTFLYAQNNGNNHRVTVEDKLGSDAWNENNKKYKQLDKEFQDLLDYWSKFYADLRNNFNRGEKTKNNALNFISQAEGVKSELMNNQKFDRINNDLNNLAKLLGDNRRNDIINKQRLDGLKRMIDNEISSTKGMIDDLDKNESKKELSVGFSKSDISASNNNYQNSTTGSNQQYNNSRYSSSSESNNYYQDAIERQRIYNQNLQVLANELTNVGVSLVNQMQQDRINNINSKNKRIDEYVEEMISLDKECSELYNDKKYDKFFLKEKELRKNENWIITDLDWLIKKTGGTNYRNLKKEITDNQKKRLREILKLHTSQLLENKKNLTGDSFIRETTRVYHEEIYDFAGELSNEDGNYVSSTGGYQIYQDWRNFIDEERKIRTQKILELNKTKNMLNHDGYEAAFYVYNNYYDAYYDEKVKNTFLLCDKELRYNILIYALFSDNHLDFRKMDDRHLRLLLGDGNEKIQYYEIEFSRGGKIVKLPLYQFLNEKESGYKGSEADRLVNEWVKSDEKKYGKKAKEIFEENLTDGSVAEQARNGSDYNLLLSEIKTNLSEGNDNKALELFKEATKLNSSDPTLFYNIGVLEEKFENYDEAIENYEQAIIINPDFVDAHYNLGVIFHQRAINIYNEMYENLYDDEAFYDLKSKWVKTLEEGLKYLEKANQVKQEGQLTAVISESNTSLGLNFKRLEDNVVKRNPSYPGGSKEMSLFYEYNTHQLSVSGKVKLKFVVNSDGSISDIDIVESDNDLLSKEAIWLLKLMPNWNPGIVDGKKVRMALILPFSF